jgi:hypothetical protein
MHAIVGRDSLLFMLAVELYLRHHPAADERCIRCRSDGCATRQRSAFVIAAARVDPALYDPPPRRPDTTRWARQSTISLPVHRKG